MIEPITLALMPIVFGSAVLALVAFSGGKALVAKLKERAVRRRKARDEKAQRERDRIERAASDQGFRYELTLDYPAINPYAINPYVFHCEMGQRAAFKRGMEEARTVRAAIQAEVRAQIQAEEKAPKVATRRKR